MKKVSGLYVSSVFCKKLKVLYKTIRISARHDEMGYGNQRSRMSKKHKRTENLNSSKENKRI